MRCNVGGVDRVVRVLLGVAILGAGLYFRSWLGVIGLVPLGTGLAGWCPLYLPFGASTCQAKTRDEAR